jgi:hypothetical protein
VTKFTNISPLHFLPIPIRDIWTQRIHWENEENLKKRLFFFNEGWFIAETYAQKKRACFPEKGSRLFQKKRTSNDCYFTV